ncbi:NAD-dependent epimerase/dehydratase family protein [Methylobacterium gregans]|uniref:UDP-glucose 4-epimerase n=1 Tax=Methylobacterium gregans TaxID=374424 RepID=A0AA37M9T2_9HYPH|nr:NAD-dependent epimerase/dehydratase family protein [Methylobacterium gregans]MDQ0522207.1 UDP-glucuronate 4-epimerase [Methylobacterium gregans]GJD77790.1 UDP-glucose 4-epimerase [Methylobacterium gregans]GLS57113.1 NAD-dependent epimerase [Methylobacterium gregans]
MRVLVTGSAGFIGYHLGRRLLAEGHAVTGLDAFSDYYDVGLKRARHADLANRPGFTPVEGRLETPGLLRDLLTGMKPEIVVHLAAQAGVRYSLENPQAYADSNLTGSFNLLEAVRANPVRHLLLASTSSAYGGNTALPFRETDRAVSPLTFYAATKLAMEAMAHSYSHLFGIPTTAFRFFTVYGPWGRPDMALFLFTRKILAGEPIEVFAGGAAERDFTYIDDLVEAVRRLVDAVPPLPGEGEPVGPEDTLSPSAAYRLVNIGGGRPVRLDAMIDTLERALGRPAERILKPLPPGDVPRTQASTELLRRLVGAVPETPITTGIPAFVTWYRDYYAAR